ncbi:hypothetical protein NMEN93004_0877 [Neisseria meningitidis 93004]|nr:hypothetical protein NMEN93004_0877 [Neisseria meningitidis 93004]
MCRLLWSASAECGVVVSAVGWASAHRPTCRCFTVVAACCCFGGLKPTLLCLRLLPHRCRLNHPNRVFLFVLSIYRHIFRFPHASAECGAVVSAVGWASAHRPACCCFTVIAACRCFSGLKPTLLCLRLLPHRCRLNHLNRVFLFVLSIRRHIFRFPHAAAECGAVAVRRRVGFSPPPRLPLFAVVSVCRCFGGLKPTLPKGKQLFAVIFVLFAAQGDFVRQAFADGVGQGIEFV